MRKRIISFVLVLVLAISMFSFQCFAAVEENSTTIQHLDDGSYIVTTIQESNSRATNTKTGTKTDSKYASNGDLEWQISLHGTFTYTGTTSTCTSSSISVNIYANNYVEVSRTAAKSGNIASGSATISRKVLGITIATDTYPLTLTCDKDGKLS